MFSKLGRRVKSESCLGRFLQMYRIRKGKPIPDRNILKKNGRKAWKNGDIDVKIAEEHVGDCHEVGNYEIEEAQVNNDIEGVN